VAEENSGNTTRGLHHYAVAVSDLDRAIGWYARVLGFETERRFGFSEQGTEIAHIVDPNGVRIELLAREGAEEGPDTGADPFGALLVRGPKHVGFLVEDAGVVWRRMRELGVELLAEPTVVEPAGVKNCFVRDPDGTMIEFDQRLD
jgi:catechol 2,3-dioxygenase-like lactoylglutathione lyase family enzyme